MMLRFSDFASAALAGRSLLQYWRSI